MGLLQRIWGTKKVVSQEEVIELTNQFYVTLRAYFAKITERQPTIDTARNKNAYGRIQELLAADVQTWTNAYEIEQLLVHLFDDRMVETELAVRVIECRSTLRPELGGLYGAQLEQLSKLYDATTREDDRVFITERRRALLSRLVNDLQWRYIVNEATRRYSKLITKRNALLSALGLVAFVSVFAFSWGWPFLTYRISHLIWLAGLAGAWGATFSMLTTLRTRLNETTFDELKLMRAPAVLLSRVAIGAGAACILFFFLVSGLLGGEAFPDLRTYRDGIETLDMQDAALLIVWCFVAGFSERLIPNLLSSTEARVGTAEPPKSDRFQPTTATAEVPAPVEPRNNTSTHAQSSFTAAAPIANASTEGAGGGGDGADSSVESPGAGEGEPGEKLSN